VGHRLGRLRTDHDGDELDPHGLWRRVEGATSPQPSTAMRSPAEPSAENLARMSNSELSVRHLYEEIVQSEGARDG
jgi:hypothetical protein